MLSLALTICLTLLTPTAPLAPPAGSFLVPTPQSRSYQRLRGRRLARFERTKGASEGGNPIQVSLPADCLLAPKLGALGRSRRWATFLHRGVRYHLRRDDPHFTQTLRKLDKRKKKGTLLRWRGRVRHVRLDGKRVLSVRLDEVRIETRTRRRTEIDAQVRLTRHDGFDDRRRTALPVATTGRPLPSPASSGQRRTG